MIYINSKNYCLIGDFNINIMSKSFDSAHATNLSQDFFNHLLEHEYTPCFLGITQPDPQKIFGGSRAVPPCAPRFARRANPPVYVKISFLHNRHDRNTHENHC